MAIEAKQPTVITRLDLYQQVWNTPMERLAETYGVTGRGLSKICDRFRIPYPPRGYWAKRAAGKNVIEPPPLPTQGYPSTIVQINPTQPNIEPAESLEVQQELEIARQKATKLVVTERLTNPHKIIAGWIAEHDRQRQQARNDIGSWGQSFAPKPYTESERRRHRLLDAVFKAIRFAA